MMADESPNAEKKLFIDEDWKSRVEAEKEAAEHAEEKPAEADHGPMPPADLAFLIGTLHLQAALGLGLIPNPTTQKAQVRLDQAKHSIDLLTVLQQKTEGNRTPEESQMLDSILIELRWAFVAVSEQVSQEKTTPGPG
jgi:hypothetical protein